MNTKLVCFFAEQTSLAKMRPTTKKESLEKWNLKKWLCVALFASAVSRTKKMQIQSAKFALVRGYHQEQEEAALLRIADTPQKYLWRDVKTGFDIIEKSSLLENRGLEDAGLSFHKAYEGSGRSLAQIAFVFPSPTRYWWENDARKYAFMFVWDLRGMYCTSIVPCVLLFWIKWCLSI